MLRHLLLAAVLVFFACEQKHMVTRVALRPSARFSFGDHSMAYPPKISRNARLPKRVSVNQIVSHPKRYRDRRVTLTGCYITDPYHGRGLTDSESSGAGIAMFGGSDDIGSQSFEWTRQRVCGTFVGVVRWKPSDVPFTYLCPDLCFVSEGTVESRIVPDRPQ
jgi:hypothetical protein